MLPPHLRKFSNLYEKYGLGAVKNFWLLTCLLPLARTVNLYKLKDYIGGVWGSDQTDPMSHYRRLTRFFEDWDGREDFLHDLMRQLLCFLKGMTLLADREYVDKMWSKFMTINKIDFVIRLRHGDCESED